MKRVSTLLKTGALVIASGVIAASVTISSARANTYDLNSFSLTVQVVLDPQTGPMLLLHWQLH